MKGLLPYSRRDLSAGQTVARAHYFTYRYVKLVGWGRTREASRVRQAVGDFWSDSEKSAGTSQQDRFFPLSEHGSDDSFGRLEALEPSCIV